MMLSTVALIECIASHLPTAMLPNVMWRVKHHSEVARGAQPGRLGNTDEVGKSIAIVPGRMVQGGLQRWVPLRKLKKDSPTHTAE